MQWQRQSEHVKKASKWVSLIQGWLLVFKVKVKVERPADKKISISETKQIYGCCFEEKELVCVLAHRGSSSGGHWVPYRKVEDVWWRLDSLKSHVVQENPFEKQDSQNIEIMMFKE